MDHSPVRQEDAEELQNHASLVETPFRGGKPGPEDETAPIVKRNMQQETTGRISCHPIKKTKKRHPSPELHVNKLTYDSTINITIMIV